MAQPTRRPMLLPLTRPGGWLCRFSFHHPMKLFVRPIVLRAAWSRKLHADSQPYPPDTQPRKPGRPGRGKGSSIVHSNDFWHPSFAEKPHKRCLHRPPLLRGQHSGHEPITAEQIPHRQRFAPLPIARTEPALEIHAPDLVGPVRHRQGRIPSCARLAGAAPSSLHQSQALQPTGNRSLDRGTPTLPTKAGMQLLGTPMRMFPAPLPDPLDPVASQTARHSMWPARPVAQPPPSAVHKPTSPFVNGLATDTGNPAALSHRHFLPEQGLHQPPTLPNNRLN